MPDIEKIGNFIAQVGWPIAFGVGMFLIAAYAIRLLLTQYEKGLRHRDDQITRAEARAVSAEGRLEKLTHAVESQTAAARDLERTVLELLIRAPRRRSSAKEPPESD